MLVRRRCVALASAGEAPDPARSDSRSSFEDAGDGAYWGGADLVFEGP